MFNLSFKYLEIDIISVLLPKASEKAEVKTQPHVLNEASMLGKHIK
jgi:hypothetical protein